MEGMLRHCLCCSTYQLKLFYINQLKNKEIAKLFDDSPQNISQLHKQALHKIKKYMTRNVQN